MTKLSAGHYAAAARHRRHFLFRLDHLGIDELRFEFNGRFRSNQFAPFTALKDNEDVPLPDVIVQVPVSRLTRDTASNRRVMHSTFLDLPLPEALEVWATEFMREELPNWQLGYGLYGVVVLQLWRKAISIEIEA